MIEDVVTTLMWVLGGLFATIQAVSLVWIAYLQRDLTKAKAHKETSEATQTTAGAFAILTETVSKMASDYGSSVIKMIDHLNNKDTKIDELETSKRQISNDLEDVRKQLNEMTISSATRDKELEMMRDSITTLNTANQNQAKDITELRARVLTLQDDNQQKSTQLIERDKAIAERDKTIEQLRNQLNTLSLQHNQELQERNNQIRQLEERIKHLESEVGELKKATPSPDVPSTEKKEEAKEQSS